jgi:hypothetical protein
MTFISKLAIALRSVIAEALIAMLLSVTSDEPPNVS